MTVTVKTLVAGTQLLPTASTYYTAGSNTKAIIHNATIYNTASSNAVTATVHLVDTGASETSSNMIIGARTISPLETYKCPELVGKTLSATGTIRALASSSSTLSFHVSGVEVT